MNRSESSRSGEGNLLSSLLRKKFGRKTVGGAAVVLLVGAYSFIQPTLNARLGWNLPALRQDSGGQVVGDSAKSNNRTKSTTAANSESSESPTKPNSTKLGDGTSIAKSTKPTQPNQTRGPLADRLRPTEQQQANDTRGSPAASSAPDKNLRYGLLREIGRDRYLSPAGVEYGPGSQEGHRLEHLKRHTKDIPNRPGNHGVFDGGMEGALQTIDVAYERAKKGQRTTKQQDGKRTIYTVDLGKRIGFIGGESGKRKRNPMARRVKIIVEGSYLVTAYPL